MLTLFLLCAVGSIGSNGFRWNATKCGTRLDPSAVGSIVGSNVSTSDIIELAMMDATKFGPDDGPTTDFVTSLVQTTDTPLFKDMAKTRFKGVARALRKDSGSVLKRLLKAFKTTGANIVVVGAGGAGKTETILRALEDEHLTKASFDLRGWFLEEASIDKKEYMKRKSGVTAGVPQLAMVKVEEKEIKDDIKSKSADVLFFDEMDLGTGFLNAAELETMEILLSWGKDVAPLKSKVLVLHPLVSTQPEVLAMLQKLGFPTPGAESWIDFSDPYSPVVEKAIVKAILADCVGSSSKVGRVIEVFQGKAHAAAIEDIMGYIRGLPSAYMPFLTDKDGALSQLSGKTYAQAATDIKNAAKAKIGGRLIKINIGIQSSEAARRVIKGLITDPSTVPQAGPALDGAVACMAVGHQPGTYYVPPVQIDALREYCTGDTKAKQSIAPICDAF